MKKLALVLLAGVFVTSSFLLFAQDEKASPSLKEPPIAAWTKVEVQKKPTISWGTKKSLKSLERAIKTITFGEEKEANIQKQRKLDKSTGELYKKDLIDFCKRIQEVAAALKDDIEDVIEKSKAAEEGAFKATVPLKKTVTVRLNGLMRKLTKHAKELEKRRGLIKKSSWGWFQRTFSGKGYQRELKKIAEDVLKLGKRVNEILGK